jgi:hypothetical protein
LQKQKQPQQQQQQQQQQQRPGAARLALPRSQASRSHGQKGLPVSPHDPYARQGRFARLRREPVEKR